MLSPETELLMQQGAALRDLRAELSSVQFEAPAEPPLLEKLADRRSPHRKFAGLDIFIENPVGSVRSGVSKSGKKWSVTMRHPYGYIKKATGEDGEGLDVFLGPDPKAPNVHIVHQDNPDKGRFDESKVMLGWNDPDEAKAAYLSNYDGPDFFRSMTIMPLSRFKEMLTKAEPGSAHWKRRMKRPLETTAIFSAD